MTKFFSPFETGMRGDRDHPVNSPRAWVWYWRHLTHYPDMHRTLAHDCFAAINIVDC